MTLRRASGLELHRTGFGIFAQHQVRSEREVLVTLNRRQHQRAAEVVEAGGAALLYEETGRTLWWTSDGLYWDDEGLEAEEVALLAWDRRRRQDARIERLRRVRAADEAVATARRQRIPDDVRIFVWQRDDGRCARCGNEDDLQFDHVIPVARGGGNAPENIQVLCGSCNRQKSDHIA